MRTNNRMTRRRALQQLAGTMTAVIGLPTVVGAKEPVPMRAESSATVPGAVIAREPNGTEIHQVTTEPLAHSSIYCEIPYCSRDSRHFVYQQTNPRLKDSRPGRRRDDAGHQRLHHRPDDQRQRRLVHELRELIFRTYKPSPASGGILLGAACWIALASSTLAASSNATVVTFKVIKQTASMAQWAPKVELLSAADQWKIHEGPSWSGENLREVFFTLESGKPRAELPKVAVEALGIMPLRVIVGKQDVPFEHQGDTTTFTLVPDTRNAMLLNQVLADPEGGSAGSTSTSGALI